MFHPGFSVEEHAVVFTQSGTRLSFQRFDVRSGRYFRNAPRSLGALPCANRARHVIVPVAPREGLWIGCRRRDPKVQQMALVRNLGLESARLVRVDARANSTLSIIGGFRCRRAFEGFTRRKAVERLMLTVSTSSLAEGQHESVEIWLVSPRHFMLQTGRQVPPLDATAQFGGHLLPKCRSAR